MSRALRKLGSWIKTLNLPLSRTSYVGSDQRGNMYFEIRTDGPSPRRRIEYADGRNSFLDYQANDIPIQWQAWLRHTRPDAPSKEELVEAAYQMEHVKALAAEWEARVDGPKKDLALESSDQEAPPKSILPHGENWQGPKNPGQDYQPQSWSPVAGKRGSS